MLRSLQVVVKASGLAAGKGVVVPSSKEEAKSAVEEILVKKCFGGAGDQVVLEELLTGLEVSLLGRKGLLSLSLSLSLSLTHPLTHSLTHPLTLTHSIHGWEDCGCDAIGSRPQTHQRRG